MSIPAVVDGGGRLAVQNDAFPHDSHLQSRAELTEQPQSITMSTNELDTAVNRAAPNVTECFAKDTLPRYLATNDTCLDGWYCPKSSDHVPPQYCAPSSVCQVMMASGKTCEPQGQFVPRICNNGYYCPPGEGGKRELACPKGSFCPTGAREPFKCSFGAWCPAKSERQLVLLPLFVTVAIDLLLVVLVLAGIRFGRRRQGKPRIYSTVDTFDGASSALPDPGKLEAYPASSTPDRCLSPGQWNEAVTHDSARVPSADCPDPPSTNGSARMRTVSDGLIPSSRTSSPDQSHFYPKTAHWVPPSPNRRASGRADHMDGMSDDHTSVSTDESEDYSHSSPEFQRFIRSMSHTVQTDSIGLSFDFDDLGFQTKSGKNILQGVSGSIPRGSCWGIMGASGAGKSTLVNVLMGKQPTTSGSVRINGWRKDMSKYKKLIGYVPQDDIIFPELTVRENILHSARVRLPSSWRDKAIQDHVDSLIACLQLTHVQHSRVGDSRRPVISGGQRKRVNIGIELAAAPMAIFLDEPTSGLDATGAASIMRLLRAISRLGVTTIAIIHQPREKIFSSFDQVLLLSHGRSVYSGPTVDVQPYFQGLGFAFPPQSNPADTIIDIITGDGAQYLSGVEKTTPSVASIVDAWTSRGQYTAHKKQHFLADTASSWSSRLSNRSLNTTAEQEESLKRTMDARGASWLAQTYYCWKRAMVQQIRNNTSFFFEIAVGGAAGVIIGMSAFASKGHLFQGIYHPPFTILSPAVDYKSTPQLGLLGGMAIGLAASAPGYWVFGEEKQMYWRETASGHSRSAYYVGKVLSTIPRIALSSLHFTVFLGILATPLISFPSMLAINLLYFWCVYGLASVVSMAVKREDGPLIAVLFSLVIGILGGLTPPLAKVKTWHMEWFWRMSPGVWFTEAYFTENTAPVGYLYMLDDGARTLGYTREQFALDIWMLLIIGIVYRIFAYLGLILLNRRKQR